MSSTDFHHLLDRFYTVASGVVFDHDGTVDKFVGDELVAMFVPLLSGEHHAAAAIEAARALLRATGHGDPDGPWVPLGAGVHTAVTWFGAVGQGTHVELTAVGDAVNTTARLASLAAAGEILVTTDAAAAAGLDPTPRTPVARPQGQATRDRGREPPGVTAGRQAAERISAGWSPSIGRSWPWTRLRRGRPDSRWSPTDSRSSPTARGWCRPDARSAPSRPR